MKILLETFRGKPDVSYQSFNSLDHAQAGLSKKLIS